MHKTMALAAPPQVYASEGICFANTVMWGLTGKSTSRKDLEPLRLAYATYQAEKTRYQYLPPTTLEELQLAETRQDLTDTGFTSKEHFKEDRFSVLCYYFENNSPPHCLGIKATPHHSAQLFDHSDIHCAQNQFPDIPIASLDTIIKAYLQQQEAKEGPINQLFLVIYSPSKQTQ